ADMVENYMDYSSDNCMNIFTQNQKDRMQAVMANSPRRGSLAVSTACSGGGGGGGNTCTATVSSFPYNESFESGTGSWSQSTADDFDWARRSNGTPSSGTGPSSAAAGSFYMYVEASAPNYPSRNTIFNGPCFDLSALSSPEFSFQYHMLGNAVGTVSLQASTDGSSWSNVWTQSGAQGSSWNSETVDLSGYAGQSEVRLRFNATTASSWQGDICIDALELADNGGGGGGGACTDVTISITLDNYPAETSWTITNDGGTIVASGSGYSGNGSSVSETVCLDDGCYDFTINDSYGDGICCSYGNGSYTVTADGASVASGGAFGSSETTNFCLGGGGGGGSCPAINFSTINSYGGSQDNGSSSVQDGGATLVIQNNAWKSISLNYTVTANTVIEFDFRSTDQGEIHGIGFDSDNSISSNRTFRVYGTQNWGIGTYDDYSGTAWKSYTIPVGASYTGSFDRLFFVCDDDASSAGNSYFRNVKIYEGSCGSRVTSQGLRSTSSTISPELSLAPNPAKDMVNLRFKQKEASNVQISVMNAMGQTVLKEQFDGQAGENQYEINISEIASGAYFVVINDGIRTQSKRLLIQR
ncbi:MAG: T9SS type A sorting domain-containing protein, partial [Bacteroidota bacterium]